MGVRASSTLGDLANDLDKIAKRAPKDCERVVSSRAKAYNKYAKDLARERSGTHGKRYPAAWTTEKRGNAHWEFGPDSAKPQGGMDFEEGSGRQTSGHHEAADTFDLVAPSLVRVTGRMIDGWFWTGDGRLT